MKAVKCVFKTVGAPSDLLWAGSHVSETNVASLILTSDTKVYLNPQLLEGEIVTVTDGTHSVESRILLCADLTGVGTPFGQISLTSENLTSFGSTNLDVLLDGVKIGELTQNNNALTFEEWEGHVAGDIAYYNSTTGKVEFIGYQDYTSSLGEAIAVCVVPTSHNVYGTGEAGFFSVKSSGTAEVLSGGPSGRIGSDNGGDAYGFWGNDGSRYASSLDRDCLTWNNSSDPLFSGNEFGWFPMMTESGGTESFPVQCACDPLTYYSKNATEMIPSPYLANGRRNVNYSMILDSARGNASGRFNGLEYSNSQRHNNNWAALIVPNCYSTPGTQEWYLPSGGEFGYLCARYKTICDAITACGGDLPFTYTAGYWLCNEWSEITAYCCNLREGYITDMQKRTSRYVRPFHRFY